MDGWLLSEEELREWLGALLRDGKRLVAPVEEEALSLFRPVASAADVSLDYGNTRWSPKEFLFPSTEALFSYRFLGDEVTLDDAPADVGEQVLFGLRPCDAAGLARLDDVFLRDGSDPVYASRRHGTALVSLACERARPECFCTAVGGSPAGTEGSDLQLVPLSPGSWLVRALTAAGTELVAGSSRDWTPAAAEDWAQAEEQRRAVEEEIGRDPLPAEWAAVLEGSFDQPLWEALGERCLGCGICAYVCPSCSCFDVGDEGNAFCGTRCRTWDSCSFPRFTLHASGHNPRPTRASRYRQRVLHKFAYFPLEHEGRLMCVGCGRCLKLCPVGLDIRRAVESAAAAGEDAP